MPNSFSLKLKMLMEDYRKAVIWDVMASRSNNCGDQMRAEIAVEDAAKALENHLGVVTSD